MKKWITAGILAWGINTYAQDVPEVLKTTFTPEVLQQKITATNGNKTTVAAILKEHQGKVLVIDFWASWCGDCIKALPGTHELKDKNPDVDFVYFSLDRAEDKWKKGIEKFNIESGENYWFDQGWKNTFNNYIDLNWIPRFLIVDQKGKIAKYYAITPDDPAIQKTIDSLLKKS